MKIYPARTPRLLRPAPRIPAFHPVPGRGRRDGWTALRQAEFIGYLAQTRSVSSAARQVGMARETAYRLRARRWAEGFVAAWDAAMGKPQSGPTAPARKVTTEELRWRTECGLWQVRMTNRRFCGLVHKPDNSALLSLLGRLGPARYDDL